MLLYRQKWTHSWNIHVQLLLGKNDKLGNLSDFDNVDR